MREVGPPRKLLEFYSHRLMRLGVGGLVTSPVVVQLGGEMGLTRLCDFPRSCAGKNLLVDRPRPPFFAGFYTCNNAFDTAFDLRRRRKKHRYSRNEHRARLDELR